MPNSSSQFESGKKLELAFAEFNKEIDTILDVGDRKRVRNRVQERILAASNQVCGEYKHDLKQLDARMNFFLGSLTTGLAGAGAIFTRVDVVRALSGIAGITSGVRSEFNEDYFQNLTIQVITDGLESKRREVYDKILEDREEGLEKYPVQRAIKDAIKYHENCSLIAGLEQAAISIERNENPGADAMTRFLEKMGDTRSLLDVMTGKPPIGVDAATQDLPLLYVSLDGSNQTRSTVQSDADKRLKIPAGRETDLARTALTNWKVVVDAGFSAFDTAYTGFLKTTVEIAAKVGTLTAEIKDKKTTKDERSVKIAELAVAQAKIRVLGNEVNNAEQKLASSVDKALKGFENAMDKVKAKIEAETTAAEAKNTAGEAENNAATAAETAKTKKAEAKAAKTARDKALAANSAAEERLQTARTAAANNPDDQALRQAVEDAETAVQSAQTVLQNQQADFDAKTKAAKDAETAAAKAKQTYDEAKEKATETQIIAKKAEADAEAAAKAPSGDSGSSSAALSGVPVLPIETQPLNILKN